MWQVKNDNFNSKSGVIKWKVKQSLSEELNKSNNLQDIVNTIS